MPTSRTLLALVDKVDADPLIELEQRRASAHAELGRLQKVTEAESAAQALLSALSIEEAEVNATEQTRYTEWSKDPSGPLPAPLTTRRSDIAQRRQLAANDLAGALAAGKAVAPKIDELSAALQGINRRIFALKAERVSDEAIALNDKNHADAAAFAESTMRLNALADTVLRLQAETPDPEMRDTLQIVGQKLNQLKGPTLMSDTVRVQAFAREWQAKFNP